MTVTLIGSRAMRLWYADARIPHGDWDYHSPEPVDMELFNQGCLDRHDVFTDPRLGAWTWGTVATADELYTLKISHSHYEIGSPANWDKHASDIVFLERKGCQFLRPLYDVLVPIWKDRYRKNPTNTHQDKEAFFKDAVQRKYDHDSLHKSVAYYDRPLYESYLADGETVKSDWAKFLDLALEDKLKAAREEIYVTALERILIPRDYQGSPSAAYHWALRRTVTSLFKNEWSLFILLHLDTLMMPDCDYVQRHKDNQHKLVLLNGRN